jgi:hypothetical protein
MNWGMAPARNQKKGTGMKKKWILRTFVFLFAFGASASPVSVAVTGTANTTGMGYTQGESYTFTWLINDGYTGSDGFGDGGDIFSSTENLWFSTSTNDPWLWCSVSGGGLVGTYAKPSDNDQAPFEQLKVDSAGLLCWTACRMDSATMELLVNGVVVDTVAAYDLNIPGLDYSDTSFVNPASYLANYTGTYSSPGGGIYLDNGHAQNIEFTPTSIIIGVIPEPSTILLFGIGGIGAWLLRIIKRKGRA